MTKIETLIAEFIAARDAWLACTGTVEQVGDLFTVLFAAGEALEAARQSVG